MAKRLSEHAAAAKEIRQILKQQFPKIKFRVNSESFSMGNAVRVHWENGPTSDQVYAHIKQYQYGHFDGMIDAYEMSNTRKDIPQAKYVQVERRVSQEIRDELKKQIAQEYGIDPIDDESVWYEKTGRWSDANVSKELSDLDLTEVEGE